MILSAGTGSMATQESSVPKNAGLWSLPGSRFTPLVSIWNATHLVSGFVMARRPMNFAALFMSAEK